jgi:hypothetical protein
MYSVIIVSIPALFNVNPSTVHFLYNCDQLALYFDVYSKVLYYQLIKYSFKKSLYVSGNVFLYANIQA